MISVNKNMYLKYNGLFQKIRYRYFRKIIQDFIKSRDYILDYGCGPGDFLDVCREMGLRSIGIDSEVNNVNLARSRGFDVVQGDYMDMSFDRKTFDIIIVQSVLEHMEKPVDALLSLSQLLTDNGKIVLSVPTPGPFFWDDPTHIRPYTPKSLRILGELTNLRIFRISYVSFYLLNLYSANNFVFQIINNLQCALGTNLVCIYEKMDTVSCEK